MQTVFIGDIQGCAAEFDILLGRARAELGSDFRVGLVGDLVNRGPDNLGVLQRVRELWELDRACCVLGNHDLHLIASYWGLRDPGPFDTLGDVLERPDAGEWVEWLRRLPVVHTGVLGERPWLMVHAAPDPTWSLAEAGSRGEAISERLSASDPDLAKAFLAADPDEDPVRDDLARLTHCRSLRPAEGGWQWSSAEPNGGSEAWHEVWSRAGHDYGVIYGHWATQGLHFAAGVRGLDTGCVHHGRGGDRYLTAWLPDPNRRDPFAVPDSGFWQEMARRPYYRELMDRRTRD